MKKVSLFLGLILIFFSVSAQDDYPEVQTLFGNKGPSGGYLGFNMKMTEIAGEEALFVGGEVAFVANRAINIGVAGYGMVNEYKLNELSPDLDLLYLEMGYGGLHLEPVIHSEGVLHVTLPVLLGAGGIAQSERPLWLEEDGEVNIVWERDYFESDYFFVAEPGLNLELNVFKFMRVAAGASYRFTTDIDLGSMDKDALNGWNANLSLRVGWF
jgi:hypothetical protein